MRTIERAARRSWPIGLAVLGTMVGLVSAPAFVATAQAQTQEQPLETLVLNRGRTVVGSVVDANRNTVAIRGESGLPQIVRADDIQTVYIPARGPDDQPFFGSFVGWKDGVYELSVNFELVRVKDGVMQGEPTPIAGSRPKPAAPSLALASEPAAKTLVEPKPAIEPRSVIKPKPVAEPQPVAENQPVIEAKSEVPPSLSAARTDEGLSLTIESDPSAEDAPDITYRLTLSASLEQPLYLAYSTLDGSARAGEDYQETRDVLVIPAGELSAEVRIPLIDDDHPEPEETLTLSVGTSNSAVRIDKTRVESVIADND